MVRVRVFDFEPKGSWFETTVSAVLDKMTNLYLLINDSYLLSKKVND